MNSFGVDISIKPCFFLSALQAETGGHFYPGLCPGLYSVRPSALGKLLKNEAPIIGMNLFSGSVILISY